VETNRGFCKSCRNNPERVGEKDRFDGRWVPLIEGLPEPESGGGWGRMVLTLYDSGAMHVESMFLYQGQRQSTRYFMGENQTGVAAKVTHWMELPPIPRS